MRIVELDSLIVDASGDERYSVSVDSARGIRVVKLTLYMQNTSMLIELEPEEADSVAAALASAVELAEVSDH